MNRTGLWIFERETPINTPVQRKQIEENDVFRLHTKLNLVITLQFLPAQSSSLSKKTVCRKIINIFEVKCFDCSRRENQTIFRCITCVLFISCIILLTICYSKLINYYFINYNFFFNIQDLNYYHDINTNIVKYQ